MDPPSVKLSTGDYALFNTWYEQSSETAGFLLRAMTDIFNKLEDILTAIQGQSFAPKFGTIEIIGELDGLPAEMVGEYTTQ